MVTGKTFFLHVPKTGGTWVTGAVLASGVPARAPDAPHYSAAYSPHGHASLADIPEFADRFHVAFVRHPLDWWRSYWGHRMREGVWHEDVELDRLAGHEDFNEFIRRVIEHAPGHLGSIYENFVGTDAHQVEFVGRFEHLIDDLCNALRRSGETFDERVLRAFPAANVNDYQRFPAFYEPEVALALARSEHRAIERFYPRDAVPERVLASGSRLITSVGV